MSLMSPGEKAGTACISAGDGMGAPPDKPARKEGDGRAREGICNTAINIYGLVLSCSGVLVRDGVDVPFIGRLYSVTLQIGEHWRLCSDTWCSGWAVSIVSRRA